MDNDDIAKRYIQDRYGSQNAGMRGVAYDNGGFLPVTEATFKRYNNYPEPVLTPEQTAAFLRHVEGDHAAE